MFKESGPEFRVVGGAPEEKKEEIKLDLKERLYDGHLKNLGEDKIKTMEAAELPKTPEELAVIDLANQKNKEFMERAGISPYDVPAKNFHIVKPDFYTKEINPGGKYRAIASQANQVVVLNDSSVRTEDDPFGFGVTAFHELRHISSHYAIEAQEDIKDGNKRTRYSDFRGGLKMYSSQMSDKKGEEHEHFRGLNEVVTDYREKSFLDEMMKLPQFEKERAHMSSPEIEAIKKEIAMSKGVPEDYIYWVSPKNQEGERSFCSTSYVFQRKVLELIMNEAQKEFPDKYGSAEDVFLEFEKANYTGKILSIARLVEDLFGEGSFRILGTMGEDRQTSMQTLEQFRKMRGARVNSNKGSKETQP